jgi:diaminohydroxyphosphoribosylaminopyrimidine deaminase/5-amino-6-(5-phosphoribosylamino)uracil reductase
MPYITLKVAQSLDGYIAEKNATNKYLTSQLSRSEVHRMRSHCAVLVGINTILTDDPILDNRLMPDDDSFDYNIKKNAQLKTIILDSNLRTPPKSKIFSVKENRKIFIAYSKDLDDEMPEIKKRKKALEKQGAILIKSDTKNDEIHLRKLLSLLSVEYNIMHIMVEGGGKVFSSFINSKLFNRLIIYTAPMVIGDGVKAFPDVDKKILNDMLIKSEQFCYSLGKDIVNVFTGK